MVYYYHSNDSLWHAYPTELVGPLDKESKRCYNSSIETKEVTHGGIAGYYR